MKKSYSFIAFMSLCVACLLTPVARGEVPVLELKRVTLSSSGIGYFEYEAQISGDATLSLQVPLDQVDDVLKSLVIYDAQGSITGVSLPGQEPLAQALKQLSFDVAALNSPANLLEALRGAELIVFPTATTKTLQGRIVSVERQRSVIPLNLAANNLAANTNNFINMGQERTRVTLMNDAGLQQFVLEEVERFEFVDVAVREQVQRALSVMANNRAKDARALEIGIKGNFAAGSRTVRIAYVINSPIWKNAYRMTLSSVAHTAQLQGWAIIENLSGQDWKNIELTLTSGKPVAFRQSLYKSYFNNRPEVPVEMPGRVVPRVDNGTVAAPRVAYAAAPAPAPASMNMRASAKPSAMQNESTQDFSAMTGGMSNLVAQEADTQVLYRFPLPVSVGNGRSLSLPIIQAQLPAQRRAVYQPHVHASNPLASVEISNTLNSALPAGAVTLYETHANGGAFIGDAQLAVLPMGDKRFLSYALDQKINVVMEQTQSNDQRRLSINKGAVTVASLQHNTIVYTVKSTAPEARDVVVEVAQLPDWKLLEGGAKLLGMSAAKNGQYRLQLSVAAQETKVFSIVQERADNQRYALENLNQDLISQWQEYAMSAADKSIVVKLLKDYQAIQDATNEVQNFTQERNNLREEQTRLRENLKASPKGSEIEKRYGNEMEKSESEFERLGRAIKEAQAKENRLREQLRSYIRGL